MENLLKEYERIQKYAGEADASRYDMKSKEIQAIIECSPNVCELVFLAFNFGFAKGCRKTKKAVKA